MAQTLFVGQLQKKEAKSGKVFYSGYFGNVPVVGLVGKKDSNKIHLAIDINKVNYLKEHKGGKKKDTDGLFEPEEGSAE